MTEEGGNLVKLEVDALRAMYRVPRTREKVAAHDDYGFVKVGRAGREKD